MQFSDGYAAHRNLAASLHAIGHGRRAASTVAAVCAHCRAALMDGCVTAACAAALMPQHCRPCAPRGRPNGPRASSRVVAAYDRPRQQFRFLNRRRLSSTQRLEARRSRTTRPGAAPRAACTSSSSSTVTTAAAADRLHDRTTTTATTMHIVDWMACLTAAAGLAFTMNRLRQTGPWMGEAAPRSALVEQCWRNILDVFGASAAAVEPRVLPWSPTSQGPVFMASRAPAWRHRGAVDLRASGRALCRRRRPLPRGRAGLGLPVHTHTAPRRRSPSTRRS